MGAGGVAVEVACGVGKFNGGGLCTFGVRFRNSLNLKWKTNHEVKLAAASSFNNSPESQCLVLKGHKSWSNDPSLEEWKFHFKRNRWENEWTDNPQTFLLKNRKEDKKKRLLSFMSITTQAHHSRTWQQRYVLEGGKFRRIYVEEFM